MTLITFITQFFNIVTLAGVIILSRMVRRDYQIAIGIILVILGLIFGATK